MQSQEQTDLHSLLNIFNVAGLGQGDPIVGTNLLASMACTLANLAPTDSTVVNRDGSPARLGTSLLVSGSASAGRVVDEVITEVSRCQSNLAANLQSYLNHLEEQKKKIGVALPPTGPKSSAIENVFAETQSEMGSLFCSREQLWGRILDETPPEQVTDLGHRPKFLISAAKPSDLEVQLQGLRPGRPLVYLGIGRPRDLAEFADPGAALIEGRYPIGNGCELVRANMLVTDPMGMIGEAAKAPDNRTAWLGHFLWLCDGDAGPDAPAAGGSAQSTETTTERFRIVINQVITRRLNMPEKKPIVLAHDTREAAARWTAFLREMEPRLPGISGAARNLLNSLVFGLGQMANIEKRLTFSMAGVEAFGQFLVRRMASARAAVLHAGAIAQRRSQIERVVRKLSSGQVKARTIYRDLSIPADDCNECLLWLEEAAVVRRVDDRWDLVQGARLSFNDCTAPLLEA
jgi:hypothetical protein